MPGAAHAAAVHMASVCQEMHPPAVHNLCNLHVKEMPFEMMLHTFIDGSFRLAGMYDNIFTLLSLLLL